ncbi:pyruvate kinase-like protein [Aspergillus floccosus]
MSSIPQVLSVGKSSSHTTSKSPAVSITLVPGLGVQGDCHAGKNVQHLSLRQANPEASNLRQVHLVAIETLRQVSAKLVGMKPLSPGEIGENITTEGLDLTSLSRGTELHFVGPGRTSDTAIVVLTGLRNPGPGMNKCRPGLKELFAGVGKRSAGVMATVKQGGVIKAGMRIEIVKPSRAEPLAVV